MSMSKDLRILKMDVEEEEPLIGLEQLFTSWQSDENVYNIISKVTSASNELLTYTKLPPYTKQFAHFKLDLDKLGNDLLKRFNEDKLVAFKATPNGSCFYNSLSTTLYGHEGHSLQLRAAILLYMVEHFDSLLSEAEQHLTTFKMKKILNENAAFHTLSRSLLDCKAMRGWGDPLLVPYCAAKALGIIIHVVYPPILGLSCQLYRDSMKFHLPEKGVEHGAEVYVMWSNSASHLNEFEIKEFNHFLPVFHRDVDEGMPMCLTVVTEAVAMKVSCSDSPSEDAQSTLRGVNRNNNLDDCAVALDERKLKTEQEGNDPPQAMEVDRSVYDSSIHEQADDFYIMDKVGNHPQQFDDVPESKNSTVVDDEVDITDDNNKFDQYSQFSCDMDIIKYVEGHPNKLKHIPEGNKSNSQFVVRGARGRKKFKDDCGKWLVEAKSNYSRYYDRSNGDEVLLENGEYKVISNGLGTGNSFPLEENVVRFNAITYKHPKWVKLCKDVYTVGDNCFVQYRGKYNRRPTRLDHQHSLGNPTVANKLTNSSKFKNHSQIKNIKMNQQDRDIEADMKTLDDEHITCLSRQVDGSKLSSYMHFRDDTAKDMAGLLCRDGITLYFITTNRICSVWTTMVCYVNTRLKQRTNNAHLSPMFIGPVLLHTNIDANLYQAFFTKVKDKLIAAVKILDPQFIDDIDSLISYVIHYQSHEGKPVSLSTAIGDTFPEAAKMEYIDDRELIDEAIVRLHNGSKINPSEMISTFSTLVIEQFTNIKEAFEGNGCYYIDGEVLKCVSSELLFTMYVNVPRSIPNMDPDVSLYDVVFGERGVMALYGFD